VSTWVPESCVIELLDFKLRGGHEAPVAASRVARVTERYLDETGSRDVTAVVTEIVAWLAGGAVPHTLGLQLSVTSSVVRISVTAAHTAPKYKTLESNELLRSTLPVTATLATRYGMEASRRTRIWAEFDRPVAHNGR